MLWLILDVIGAPSTGAGVVTRTTLQVAITRTVVAFAPDTLLVAVGAVTAAADHVTAEAGQTHFFVSSCGCTEWKKEAVEKKKSMCHHQNIFFDWNISCWSGFPTHITGLSRTPSVRCSNESLFCMLTLKSILLSFGTHMKSLYTHDLMTFDTFTFLRGLNADKQRKAYVYILFYFIFTSALCQHFESRDHQGPE